MYDFYPNEWLNGRSDGVEPLMAGTKASQESTNPLLRVTPAEARAHGWEVEEDELRVNGMVESAMHANKTRMLGQVSAEAQLGKEV